MKHSLRLLACLFLSVAGCGDDEGGGGGDTSSGADGSGDDGSGSADDGSGSDGTADDGGTGTGGTGDGTGSDTGTGTGTGTGGAIPCTEDSECVDAAWCNGEETCVDGFCAEGTPPITCDDGVDCTVDACDEASQDCVFIAQNTLCDDSDVCNGAETCDDTAGCQAGTPMVCDDGVDCTVDGCDPATGCDFSPDNTSCQDAEFCNGEEICDAVNGCGPATGPRDCDDLIACTTDSCDETGDACVNTPDDAFCDNGVFCDGAEACTVGVGCEVGTPVSCPDDGSPCSLEACSETLQDCETTFDNTVCANQGDFCDPMDPGADNTGCIQGAPCNTAVDCDDGNDCNGVEICGGAGFCQPGTAVVCDDGVGCTNDTCDTGTGNCVFTPLDGSCQDTNLCNGSEICHPTNDCVPGPPLDCDDSIACTTDTCLSQFGCRHTPDNAPCQDNSICNGTETCEVGTGCQPATNPMQCQPDGLPCTTAQCIDPVGCLQVPDNSMCYDPNDPSTCNDTCDPLLGCGDHCNVALCDMSLWQCGNCMDDDNDCGMPGGGTDSGDSDCFGPCDDNESGWKGEIPGQNESPCKADCYFDDDSGSGNDQCYWSFECDPLEPKLDSDNCDFKDTQMGGDGWGDSSIPGTGMDCEQAWNMQSGPPDDPNCEDECGPLTPNGCDCFGCCEVRVEAEACTVDTDCVGNDPSLLGPGGIPIDGIFCDTVSGTCVRTVFLGSEDGSKNGTCNLANVADPTLCRPCWRVQACANSCDRCELCIGKPDIPADCIPEDRCPPGVQACGQPTDPPCPANFFCITGCCYEFDPG